MKRGGGIVIVAQSFAYRSIGAIDRDDAHDSGDAWACNSRSRLSYLIVQLPAWFLLPLDFLQFSTLILIANEHRLICGLSSAFVHVSRLIKFYLISRNGVTASVCVVVMDSSIIVGNHSHKKSLFKFQLIEWFWVSKMSRLYWNDSQSRLIAWSYKSDCWND